MTQRMDVLVASERGEKTYWTKVGAAFPAKSKDGFDLVINDGIAVHGKMILRPPLPKDGGRPDRDCEPGQPPDTDDGIPW